MSDLIRIKQGTIVALDYCPDCGNAVSWKTTRNGEKVMRTCNSTFRDEERWGQVCGRKDQPSLAVSQKMLAQYQEQGRIDLRPSTKPQEATSNDDTDRDEDDRAGSWLDNLFGD